MVVMVPSVSCGRSEAGSVVSLVSCERSEAASVVSPVSCVGGRGSDVGFRRGVDGGDRGSMLEMSFVRVKPVAPLLACLWSVVKPLAPLSAENGCISGETV